MLLHDAQKMSRSALLATESLTSGSPRRVGPVGPLADGGLSWLQADNDGKASAIATTHKARPLAQVRYRRTFGRIPAASRPATGDRPLSTHGTVMATNLSTQQTPRAQRLAATRDPDGHDARCLRRRRQPGLEPSRSAPGGVPPGRPREPRHALRLSAERPMVPHRPPGHHHPRVLPPHARPGRRRPPGDRRLLRRPGRMGARGAQPGSAGSARRSGNGRSGGSSPS